MSPPPYNRLSRVYDHWMSPIDYESMAQRLQACTHMSEQGRPTCLDLCTGTATLPLQLSALGWRVVAIDQSSEMLRRARGKLGQSHPEVLLMEGDVVDSEWPSGPYQAVTCTSDSANYMSPEQLEAVAIKARDVLVDGGVFLFDLNTDHKLREVFGNTLYAECHDEYAYIWQNRMVEDASQILFEIDLFIRESRSEWSHGREVHTQHIYEIEAVRAIVARAGFETCHIAADYQGNDVEENSDRWVVQAQ